MGRLTSLWRLTIIKKLVMAISGVMMLGFVVGHLVGNLKIFMGEEVFNHYAAGLRELGSPILGWGQALWIARIGLLVALVLHIVAAVQLRLLSHAARPVKYRQFNDLSLSPLSKAMFWAGITIAIFVVYHLLHFTLGTVHPDFQMEEVVDGVNKVHALPSAYANVVMGFTMQKWTVLIYLAGQVALGLHLYHGVYSACQTLGLNHPKVNGLIRPVAAAIAILIPLGFVLIPVGVLADWVQTPVAMQPGLVQF